MKDSFHSMSNLTQVKDSCNMSKLTQCTIPVTVCLM